VRDSHLVRIVEVGPRDGLQNESAILPLATKIELIERLINAGLASIEVTSFVNPALVPQMADAEQVVRAMSGQSGVDQIALVPNERGYDRAIAAGSTSVEIFTAATDAFCEANTRCTVDESFDRFAPIARRADEDGVRLRGAVSVAFHCPFSGPVAATAAMQVAERLLALGCAQVAICDTTGRATTDQIEAVLDRIVAHNWVDVVAFHLHDTFGLASSHIERALQAGVRTFDASVGGLGGCPFAPGAPGNVSTEAVLGLLDRGGYEHGIEARSVGEIGRWIRRELDVRSDAGN
jgi:hydroxymethylglutaryl-CoA lyase